MNRDKIEQYSKEEKIKGLEDAIHKTSESIEKREAGELDASELREHLSGLLRHLQEVNKED